MKTTGINILDSLGHIPWYISTKVDKYFSCYLFLSLSEQVVYFHEAGYCINLSHYLQLLAEVGILKMLYTIQRKRTVSESLFNEPRACYFFNKRLRHRHFLADTEKPYRTPSLQEQLDTPDSVFMEHICNYNNIKFNVN